MVVEFVTTTFVAGVAPNSTAAPVKNPVPLIVTGVPPRDGPVDGVTEETVGAGVETVTVKPLKGAELTPAAGLTVTVRSVAAAAGVMLIVIPTLVAVAVLTVAVTPVPLKVTAVVPL